MNERCDGLTYGGQHPCNGDARWTVVPQPSRGGRTEFWSCGHHLSQVCGRVTKHSSTEYPIEAVVSTHNREGQT